MCDPTGGFLTAAAIAVSAAGAVQGGMAANRAAKYNAAVSENNSVYAQRQAADALARGDEDVVAAYRKVGLLKGQQQAAIGASGFDGSFGTPASIVSDTDRLAGEDAGRLRENSTREAQGYYINADNYTAEAAGQRQAGRDAMTAGVMKAGATILGGASSYAAKYGGAAGGSAGKTIKMTQRVQDIYSGGY